MNQPTKPDSDFLPLPDDYYWVEAPHFCKAYGADQMHAYAEAHALALADRAHRPVVAGSDKPQHGFVLPPFAAPASQHGAGFRGTISAGEYSRDTGMMYVTVKLPFKGLPEELLTINGPAMIAPVSESAASGFREGRNAQPDSNQDDHATEAVRADRAALKGQTK